MAQGTRQNFSENSPEARDFGAEFFSMYRSIFPAKSSPLPSSLSLTPSTRSSSAGGGGGCYEDESTTEHRLIQARLILEHQQLNDQYDLFQTHLRNLNKEIDFLRRENAELRSVNTELLKILSSPAAFQGFLLSSGAYPNQSLLDSFRRLDIGGVLAPDHGHGVEDVSDISPTSVMETNRIERPSAERVSLPKSISVRSTGYQKAISHSPGNSSREGPGRSSNRPRSVPNPIASRTETQRVYVPGVGEKEEESGGLELDVYNQGMFKTELCNKWQQTGACPYGEHCQFAHGITELRPVIRHPRYKTEICRMVLSGERCPYGHRCHFRHSLTEQERLLLPR
ncbi:zinc finger CCCH domain-containing protein 14 [Morus notabilis]|nr:zinc finger CCCH domain-containing protein 14 [Morus notabilis]